ncbi:hypothetical protein A7U60_g4327 [Sanghuangporus baumii]|uniref:Uncharacterized protein n=1 Tax=Sanghuangporus baumii TaxID=108892 RepID=A0A9Q5HYS8_SANBA|nr:hypothetical protein A7U60_g4327 [Sanghuangporus baumii]
MEVEPTTTKARGRRAADEDLTYQYEEPYDEEPSQLDIARMANDDLGQESDTNRTGPWFKKIGMKIQPRYLESDVDLDELVQGFKKYLEELKKKCKVDSAGEIVLMNMNNEWKGSKCSESVLQNATKPTSVAEAMKGDLNIMLAPHIKEIKQNLQCSMHPEEVCYVRADGTHIYYTMKNYFDHARLLLSKAPGVTASEVLKQLNLLDYHKSKRTVQTTLGSTAIGMQQGLTNQAGAGQAQADENPQTKPGVENSSAGRTRHASPSPAELCSI